MHNCIMFLWMIRICIVLRTDNNEHVDVQNGTTRTGSKILVEGIPPNILLTVDSFYICELCGKVYWDGSHLQKVLDGRLRGIVDP